MIAARTMLTTAVILLGACGRTQPVSRTKDSSVAHTDAGTALVSRVTQGSFAFANSDGTQLLALDSLADPSTILGAVCSGGVAVTARYDHRATRQSGGNGRQVAANFANEQGDVFRVSGSKATSDQTCYLSADSLLMASARGATMQKPADCATEQVSRIAAAKSRQVIHCWDIASAPTHVEVLAVQFADIDSAALASLVVFSGSSLWFDDFPAVHRAGDESVWRVDDEGVFSPTSFDVLFVAESPDGLVIAITWAGAEGEDSYLLRTDSAASLRTLSKAYRYWSPT
ncbi:MAG: hypothetical protein ACJ8AK_06920 [Gemmatimonadaceae bacterium]